MSSWSARTMLGVGLLAGVVVLVAGSDTVASVALAAALVLLAAAFLTELARRRDPTDVQRARAARLAGLFVCGVLVFADDVTVATVAVSATIVLLFAVGFVEGRMRAVWWAAVLLPSALAADLLWYVEWHPFDRSEDYESLPQSPFVLIGLPAPMALVALGVAARWGWRRARSLDRTP